MAKNRKTFNMIPEGAINPVVTEEPNNISTPTQTVETVESDNSINTVNTTNPIEPVMSIQMVKPVEAVKPIIPIQPNTNKVTRKIGIELTEENYWYLKDAAYANRMQMKEYLNMLLEADRNTKK